MTITIAINEGDIVALRGEDGEWLVESITDGDDGEITYYKESTGDFIQVSIKDGLVMLDRVIKKAG